MWGVGTGRFPTRRLAAASPPASAHAPPLGCTGSSSRGVSAMQSTDKHMDHVASTTPRRTTFGGNAPVCWHNSDLHAGVTFLATTQHMGYLVHLPCNFVHSPRPRPPPPTPPPLLTHTPPVPLSPSPSLSPRPHHPCVHPLAGAWHTPQAAPCLHHASSTSTSNSKSSRCKHQSALARAAGSVQFGLVAGQHQ